MEGAWRVSGRCLKGVWKVSRKCLEDVWMVTEWCLMGVWLVSGAEISKSMVIETHKCSVSVLVCMIKI